MNKTTFITILCFCASIFFVNAQAAKQGFDNKVEDNWSYSSNIPFYANNNNTDIWRNQSNANGRIPGPFGGANFLAGRDLDNPYTEQVTGLSSPEHILTFDAINISGVQAEVSFRYHYVGLDKGDYIYFQLRYDNGTDWNYVDHQEDVFRTTRNGNFNSTGWDEADFDVPSGHSYIRMRLVIYQNGNEYVGFDDFELKTATLSNKYNLIDGFSFGPNPTSSTVNFKANVALDKITVYNVLGKEVLRKKGTFKTMSLDLTNVPSGIYLAQIEAGDITQTLKLIRK